MWMWNLRDLHEMLTWRGKRQHLCCEERCTFLLPPSGTGWLPKIKSSQTKALKTNKKSCYLNPLLGLLLPTVRTWTREMEGAVRLLFPAPTLLDFPNLSHLWQMFTQLLLNVRGGKKRSITSSGNYSVNQLFLLLYDSFLSPHRKNPLLGTAATETIAPSYPIKTWHY